MRGCRASRRSSATRWNRPLGGRLERAARAAARGGAGRAARRGRARRRARSLPRAHADELRARSSRAALGAVVPALVRRRWPRCSARSRSVRSRSWRCSRGAKLRDVRGRRCARGGAPRREIARGPRPRARGARAGSSAISQRIARATRALLGQITALSQQDATERARTVAALRSTLDRGPDRRAARGGEATAPLGERVDTDAEARSSPAMGEIAAAARGSRAAVEQAHAAAPA